MNIVHLANTPLSGSPYSLMRIQRAGGHNARLISHRNSYDGRNAMVYPYDIILQSGRTNVEKRKTPDFSANEIHEIFHNADVFHCHNYLVDLYVFKLFPYLKKYLEKKLTVIQFHSPRVSLKNVEENINYRHIDQKLVVAQYQVRQFPECTPVPNAIPIDDQHFTPLSRNNRNPIIAYSPSNTNLRDWNNKGYPETMAALKRIKTPHETRVITNTPYLKCLKQKQEADIVIDEIITGSYHLNTLEALSMGQVAVCNLDDKCEKVLCDYTGTSLHPIVKANKANLTEVLEDLLQNPDKLKSKQNYSRSFMQTFWNNDRLVRGFKRIYNQEEHNGHLFM